MSSHCHSLLGLGTEALVIDIECHVSNNLPLIVIVGQASRSVNEARDRLRGAFASTGLRLPRKRITINLAPADIPKADSGLDLAMALSIMLTDKQLPRLTHSVAAIGELGLDGSLKPVRGIIGKLLAGRAAGISDFFIPKTNLAQANLVPGVHLYPLEQLGQLRSHLTGSELLPRIATGDGRRPTAPMSDTGVHLSDIAGQSRAKRALIIAAAGGHHLMLTGPPGTGKTMLAQALPNLLPPLSHDESLEVTHLHSLISHDYGLTLRGRPFRSPHHTISPSAMLGNGARLGEASLSHRGVLCLDEFPEFSRQTLEALRQPLEERVISVVHGKRDARLPADWQLVATANPCPCGFYGSKTRECRCLGLQRQRYQSKLSGPLMDRIDLCCEVHETSHSLLLEPAIDEVATKEVVLIARQRQAERYQRPLLNATVDNRLLRQTALLTTDARQQLQRAAEAMGLSARGFMRVLRVARTIADLSSAEHIASEHITEALSYRLRSATV